MTRQFNNFMEFQNFKFIDYISLHKLIYEVLETNFISIAFFCLFAT